MDILHAGHSTADSPEQISAELIQQLGPQPEAVVLFFAPRHSGPDIARRLRAKWPGVSVIGCSTAGEISTGRLTRDGVGAAALGRDLVKRRALAMAHFEGGVAQGIRAAVSELEAALGQPLRSLSPQTHVGLIFLDSTHAVEEAAHIELGNLAPLLSFVGGSAGDNLAFQSTHVLVGESITQHGCALMVMEVARPFHVVKVCHFEPTGVHFQVTSVDGRKLQRLDGRPAAQVYAEYVGLREDQLTLETLAAHPAGVLIDNKPWVRQVVPPTQGDGNIYLGCEVVAGSTLHFFRPIKDIVTHLREQVATLRGRLGTIQGALLFDCGLRRLEIDATRAGEAYARVIDFPAAGFNTHGESWLGHMHQTLTAVAFG